MFKKSTSVLKIITKSLSTFVNKFPEFIKYMFYPVFGQLAGVAICFLPALAAQNPQNINIPAAFLCLIAGLVLFCHAFWKFLLISGGLVLISRQMVENEPLKEFEYYTKAFEKRSKDYITYLLIMILISLLFVALAGVWLFAGIAQYGNLANADMALIQTNVLKQGAILALVCFLIGAFLTVCLESFVLNPNLTPFQGILKGIKLVAKNYLPTIGLAILIAIVCLIWSEVAGAILKNSIFKESLYMEKPHYANMLLMLQATAQGCFTNILLPFTTLCHTWWYLRMEKENNATIAY